MSAIKVEIMCQDDVPAVVEHLHKFFCLDEPILRSLELAPSPHFHEICTKLIVDDISLKAVNEQGKIVGIFLSEIKRRGADKGRDRQPSEVNETNVKERMIPAILDFLEQSADIFGRYPDIDLYADGAIISVDADYRSYGIGSKLFRRLIELCRERNLPVLKVCATSNFTAKICEKFGMTNIFEIAYRDVKLDDLPSYNVAEPHTHARNYCLDLRKSIASDL